MSGHQIEGSTAFVTGANRGIGKAIVEALLDRGAKKVYAAARRPSELASLAEAHGDRLVPVELDVTDSAGIRAAAEQGTDVDLVVNNAGIVALGGSPFEDPAWLDAGRKEMDVNLFAPFEITQAFAPTLGQNGGGAIVNVSSIAGLSNFPLFLTYSLSKAAIHSLSQATRVYLGGQGTLVTTVYPGPVDTDMAEEIDMPKETPRAVADRILDGVESGAEEVYPDAMAEQFGEAYNAGPKGLERQVAAMVSEEAQEPATV